MLKYNSFAYVTAYYGQYLTLVSNHILL